MCLLWSTWNRWWYQNKKLTQCTLTIILSRAAMVWYGCFNILTEIMLSWYIKAFFSRWIKKKLLVSRYLLIPHDKAKEINYNPLSSHFFASLIDTLKPSWQPHRASSPFLLHTCSQPPRSPLSQGWTKNWKIRNSTQLIFSLMIMHLTCCLRMQNFCLGNIRGKKSLV